MARYEDVKYFSDFGGLWTDRIDADDELDRRVADGRIDPATAAHISMWMESGYVLLPGAVPSTVCDRLRSDIETAWQAGDERLRILPPGSQAPEPLLANSPTEGMRVVDIYVFFESARQALFSPSIMRFLNAVFDGPPLLFQSLSFERGSGQGMHQDTAYVVVDPPLSMAASWIALQDVAAGSGELMYFAGSHRLPEYKFSGEFKHWNRERDGDDQHTEWSLRILEQSERLGMPYRTFLPKKGDALIWHADLAHGGSPPVDPEASRKSLVGHYCGPDARPNYFGYAPDRRTRIAYDGGAYASEYFAVADNADGASATTGAGSLRGLVRRARRRLGA